MGKQGTESQRGDLLIHAAKLLDDSLGEVGGDALSEERRDERLAAARDLKRLAGEPDAAGWRDGFIAGAIAALEGAALRLEETADSPMEPARVSGVYRSAAAIVRGFTFEVP